MSDLVEGKLVWRGEKQKRQRFIVVTTKSGLSQFPVAPPQISVDIPDEADEIEVAATRDASGRPVLEVRAIGQDFKSRQPIPRVRAVNPQGPNVEELKAEFHNPYNFIPAPDREQITGELGDREPSGHDCYSPKLFSGKLHVKLNVETPLLIPDTARVTLHPADAKPAEAHKSFPLRIGVDGKPHLAVTSVKGMLRSAYEAVTNSRFGVFNKHDESLGFRMEPKDALQLVPARIEGNEIAFYTGTCDTSKIGSPNRDEPMYAAWLGEYGKHKNIEAQEASGRTISAPRNDHGLNQHGREVWAYISLWEHKRFKFWNIVELVDGKSPKPTTAPTDKRDTWRNGEVQQSRNAGGNRWVRGYVCITNQNIENKHDERIFFFEPVTASPQQKAPLTDNHKREWKRLIEDYGEIHEGEDPPRNKNNNKFLFNWSAHIKDPRAYKELKDGTLCYARIRRGKSGWEVSELYPVMISRRIHKLPPSYLLSDSLKPARSADELSPADRVFGWVNQAGKGAYRGQLRIGTIECKTGSAKAIRYLNKDEKLENKELGVPLAILGQPKPQQGRFYVAEDKQGNAQPGNLNNEAAGYDSDSKGLRGRKVYPHHADLPSDYWSDPTEVSLETASSDKGFFKEYRRRRDRGKEQRDKQNRSIQAWIEPGTTFEFDLHITNLSAVELGALLWLVTQNESVDNGSVGSPRFFRLGGGKPLGFGSVKLSLAGCDVRDGAAWGEYYRDLGVNAYDPDYKTSRNVRTLDDGNDSNADVEQVVSIYKDTVSNAYRSPAFDQVPFIAAFLRATSGFETGLPVHYPRARHHYRDENPDTYPMPPHEEGLAYEWFVENAKEPKDRLTRYSLPDLSADDGLPIFPHEVRQGE